MPKRKRKGGRGGEESKKAGEKAAKGNEEMKKVRNVVENCTCRDNKEREKHKLSSAIVQRARNNF